MMKRDFLTFWDLSTEECETILKRSRQYKSGVLESFQPLKGKTVGLLFEKTSTRTRLSFEVGVYQLGAFPIYIGPGTTQLARGETISDTARVLSRYLGAVVIRTFSQDKIVDFAQNSTVPVINGLTDTHHPCQVLADLMTIEERKGGLKGIKLAYVGDGNNVANSLIEASARMGIRLAMACPEGYEPDPAVIERVKPFEVPVTNDPSEAAYGADVIYTDVWVSMGDNTDAEAKKARFLPFQVNDRLLSLAVRDAIVLHCLPAHRGEEITDSVMDGKHSAVFDQAENRLHTQKALLEMIVG